MRQTLLVILPILGCNPDKGSGDSATTDAPTWEQDVAPIVAGRCAGCHTEGGVAFALDVYDLAKPQAAAMAEATSSGLMPPWGAIETDRCTPARPFKDDMRLTDEEKATIAAWAEGGAPRGDTASPASLPESPDLSLARVDQEVTPLAAYTASGDDDEFVCFVLDPELTETRYLEGVQVQPGNREVVHHVLVYTDPEAASTGLMDENGRYDCFGGPGVGDTGLVAAWAPGAFPVKTPDGVAMPVEAGTLLVMQIHYHPRGLDQDPDLTSVQLQWSEGTPEHLATMALIGNSGSKRAGLESGPNDSNADRPEFRIPADVADHTESMSFEIGSGDYPIFAVGTHMHYVGTDMVINLEHGGDGELPTTDCLLETPAWDFNWQRWYNYDTDIDDLPTIHAGDTLWMQCTYDNTLDNPGVVQALEDIGETEPQDVYLGEETTDEMCLGVFGIIYY